MVRNDATPSRMEDRAVRVTQACAEVVVRESAWLTHPSGVKGKEPRLRSIALCPWRLGSGLHDSGR